MADVTQDQVVEYIKNISVMESALQEEVAHQAPAGAT